MENYFNPSVQIGSDMVDYMDDSHNICSSQHPHFTHVDSYSMPASINVLLDNTCFASVDNGCLPLINSHDESLVANLICSQSQLEFCNFSPIAEQNRACSHLRQETELFDLSFQRLNESKQNFGFLNIQDEIKGSFEKWKPSPCLNSLGPKRRQSIHMRCFRLMKYISHHRIRDADSNNTDMSMRGDVGINVRRNHDKLAIHHVIAERKRREDMEEMFSTLRELLPIKTKKGRPTVLLQTIDYVISLKRRVEELEKRNEELERFITADHIL